MVLFHLEDPRCKKIFGVINFGLLILLDNFVVLTILTSSGGHLNVAGQLVAGYNHRAFSSEHEDILQRVADKLEEVESSKPYLKIA